MTNDCKRHQFFEHADEIPALNKYTLVYNNGTGLPRQITSLKRNQLACYNGIDLPFHMLVDTTGIPNVIFLFLSPQSPQRVHGWRSCVTLQSINI